MKKQQSTIVNRNVRLTWFGLVFTLSVCTTVVVQKQCNNSHDRSFQQIELLKDSLVMQSHLHEKSSLLATWMNVIQQKQLLEVIRYKDSLTTNDQQLIRKIDQELNTMLHERN